MALTVPLGLDGRAVVATDHGCDGAGRPYIIVVRPDGGSQGQEP